MLSDVRYTGVIDGFVGQGQDVAVDVPAIFRKTRYDSIRNLHGEADVIVIVEYDRNRKIKSLLCEIPNRAELNRSSRIAPAFDLIADSIPVYGLWRQTTL